MNDFSALSAESEVSRLAQVASNEAALDTAGEPVPSDVDGSASDCGDNLCPRCGCDPCKCFDEEPHGWPGDGSGEDDLADLMAHGDEGCCDGPEDLAPADEPEDAYLDAAFEDRFDCGD